MFLNYIKDLPFQLKNCDLVLYKQCYACSCGKKFYESYNFLPNICIGQNSLQGFNNKIKVLKRISYVFKALNISVLKAYIVQTK